MSNKPFKGLTPTGRAISEPQLQLLPTEAQSIQQVIGRSQRNSFFSHAGTITGRWPSTKSPSTSNIPKGDNNE